MKNRNQFSILLNDKNLLDQALEIGTFKGEFAIPFRETWKGTCLTVVDPWAHYDNYEDYRQENLEDIFIAFCCDVKKFAEKIEIIKDYSENAARLFADEYFDFIYIDANHSYHYIKNDIEIWWPKVKKNGILAGHDFGHSPVYRAINEFSAKYNLQINSTDDGENWYIYKDESCTKSLPK